MEAPLQSIKPTQDQTYDPWNDPNTISILRAPNDSSGAQSDILHLLGKTPPTDNGVDPKILSALLSFREKNPTYYPEVERAFKQAGAQAKTISGLAAIFRLCATQFLSGSENTALDRTSIQFLPEEAISIMISSANCLAAIGEEAVEGLLSLYKDHQALFVREILFDPISKAIRSSTSDWSNQMLSWESEPTLALQHHSLALYLALSPTEQRDQEARHLESSIAPEAIQLLSQLDPDLSNAGSRVLAMLGEHAYPRLGLQFRTDSPHVPAIINHLSSHRVGGKFFEEYVRNSPIVTDIDREGQESCLHILHLEDHTNLVALESIFSDVQLSESLRIEAVSRFYTTAKNCRLTEFPSALLDALSDPNDRMAQEAGYGIIAMPYLVTSDIALRLIERASTAESGARRTLLVGFNSLPRRIQQEAISQYQTKYSDSQERMPELTS